MKSPKIETTKKFKHYGEKVKQIDFHPVQPLVLLAQYNGHLAFYNYVTQAFVKKIEVSAKALRCGVWAGEDCVLTSGDDNQVRIFNFHSMQKLHQFEPHKDFVRRVIFNKKQNYILSCSDDKTVVKFALINGAYVKDGQWEEHKHFVMDIKLNPKEENTFASASLDGFIKLWNIKSTTSNFTLKGHRSGVNCVAFCSGDKPLLLSGGDDFTTILWDLSSRSVLRKLEHHAGNVMDVLFLDPLPFFVSLSEDGKINFYNMRSFSFSFEVNNFMAKGWSLSSVNGLLAAGYDEGAVVLRLGAETPPAACSQGRLLLVSSGEAQTCNFKALQLKSSVNFDRVDFDLKELGRPEIFPSKVSFAENGNVLCLQDGSDFVMYKFQGFKQIAFGKAKDFVWGSGSKFAILTDRNEVAIGTIPAGEAGSAVAVDMNDLSLFKVLSFDFLIEGVFGGTCLGIAGNEGVVFYSWEGKIVGKVEVECKGVFWEKNLFIIQSAKSFFLLRFTGNESPFELVVEVNDTIQSGLFYAGLFFYINDSFRFSVIVDDASLVVGHTNKANLILGYIPNHERFFFFDYQNKLSTCLFSKGLMELLRADPAALASGGAVSKEVQALSSEERDFLSKATIKHPEIAYLICANPRWKFDLGLKIKRLEDCLQICREQNDGHLWKKLGSAAMDAGKFSLAETAFKESEDFNSLLLLFSSLGNKQGMLKLAETARAKRNYNVAFIANWQVNNPQACLDILLEQESFGPAVAFSKNYLPAQLTVVIEKWKASLAFKSKADAAQAARFSDNFQLAQGPQLKLIAEIRQLIGEVLGDMAVPASRFDAYFDQMAELDLFKLASDQGIAAVKAALEKLKKELFVESGSVDSVNAQELKQTEAKTTQKKAEQGVEEDTAGWESETPETPMKEADS